MMAVVALFLYSLYPIVSGLALSDPWMILSGAIPAAVLAVLVDALLALAEKAVTPRGLAA